MLGLGDFVAHAPVESEGLESYGGRVPEELIPVVVEALSEQLPLVVNASLDAPLVEGVVGEVNQCRADLTALELASLDLKAQEADLQTITSQYASDISALDFGGDS